MYSHAQRVEPWALFLTGGKPFSILGKCFGYCWILAGLLGQQYFEGRKIKMRERSLSWTLTYLASGGGGARNQTIS